MPTRRRFLTAGGLALASLAVPRRTRAGGVVEIMMRSTARGEEAWFEPIGVRHNYAPHRDDGRGRVVAA